MNANHPDPQCEIQSLKQEFAARGLNLWHVWQPTPHDPALEGRQLRGLLTWVQAYEKHGNRNTMEQHGFAFPPVDPDCDPESDWLLFESWMQGTLHRESLRNKIQTTCELLPPERMDEAQIPVALAELLDALAAQQIEIDDCDGMPDFLRYAELYSLLDETAEILAPGTTMHVGCDGFCPGCLRRPWCESGLCLWVEDTDVGCMAVPELVKRFVTDADLALERLEAVDP